MKHVTLITAAGGNGTAIQTINQALTREEYISYGKKLSQTMAHYGVEQVGFLIPDISHFEMAGGEFCGNASRAAAIILSKIQNRTQVTFTVSRFKNKVIATVNKRSTARYDVCCKFPGMKIMMQSVTLANDRQASVIDLGGIVHVILEEAFPKKQRAYQVHREIVKQLDLSEREAVGVIWLERERKNITMHPVVWVKDINTFFYEQSCGSGAIAAKCVTGASSIVQPAGKVIEVEITKDVVFLRSEMEIIR